MLTVKQQAEVPCQCNRGVPHLASCWQSQPRKQLHTPPPAPAPSPWEPEGGGVEAAASRSACATISGARCLRSCDEREEKWGGGEVGCIMVRRNATVHITWQGCPSLCPCCPPYCPSHRPRTLALHPPILTWKIWLYSTTASLCFSASFSPSTATWRG